MTEPLDEARACENTDREIWRGPDEGGGDFYADSLHITKGGGLGINCGGSVYVKPIREWHRLAGGPIRGLRAAHERCDAESAAPADATHMRRPEYLTAWLFDRKSTMPVWLIEKYQSRPLPDDKIGHFATAVDGEFWRWLDPAKFDELFRSLVPPPSEAGREAIARIIDPTAKFDNILNVTWSRYEIQRRDLAYAKADAILALSPDPGTVAVASAQYRCTCGAEPYCAPNVHAASCPLAVTSTDRGTP